MLLETILLFWGESCESFQLVFVFWTMRHFILFFSPCVYIFPYGASSLAGVRSPLSVDEFHTGLVWLSRAGRGLACPSCAGARVAWLTICESRSPLVHRRDDHGPASVTAGVQARPASVLLGHAGHRMV